MEKDNREREQIQGQNNQKRIRCINRSKYNHREVDPATGNRIPVRKFQDYYLCEDCIAEIKNNRWFLPIAIWQKENNVEQLQDWPGRIVPPPPPPTKQANESSKLVS